MLYYFHATKLIFNFLGGIMKTYKLNEDKMFNDIADGIAIVINTETGIYYGMNGLGTSIFQNLLNGASVENILAALQEIPGAPDDLTTCMANFTKNLEDFEIVIPGDVQEEVEIVLDPLVARGDNFEFNVEEFSDAQELLLADPIHEVKETTGWQPEKSALEPDKKLVQEKSKKQL